MGNFMNRVQTAVKAVKRPSFWLYFFACWVVASVCAVVLLSVVADERRVTVQADPTLGKYVVYQDTLYRLVKPELKQERNK
jgi:membrane protein YdbS with pleckstrin-like domain